MMEGIVSGIEPGPCDIKYGGAWVPAWQVSYVVLARTVHNVE
jgi:hypothetical protein